jgi:hypothetical protein
MFKKYLELYIFIMGTILLVAITPIAFKMFDWEEGSVLFHLFIKMNGGVISVTKNYASFYLFGFPVLTTIIKLIFVKTGKTKSPFVPVIKMDRDDVVTCAGIALVCGFTFMTFFLSYTKIEDIRTAIAFQVFFMFFLFHFVMSHLTGNYINHKDILEHELLQLNTEHTLVQN